MQRIFTYISQTNLWESSESVSGRGSELAGTAAIRSQLPILLQELKITSILDAPCGDFNWMRHLQRSQIAYTGVDVVSAVIDQNQHNYGNDTTQFFTADITTSDLPTADLIMCRDCLVHLSWWDANNALKQFKLSGSKYLLTTTYPDTVVNKNTPTGSWRALNLCLPPFNFPAPLQLIADLSDDTQVNPDKSLGLWQLADLTNFTVDRWSSPQMMLDSLVRKYLNPAWKL